MIHPGAIKEFRNKPRDDHTWMKELTHKELNQACRELGIELDRAEEHLEKHQKVSILLGIAHKCFAFWLDMGSGKTRVALELLRYWMTSKQITKAVVVAPSETVLFGWEAQIKRFKIGIPYITLPNSSSAEKWNQLAEFDKGIILATFPGLTRMVSTKRITKKGKGKLGLKPSLVKRFAKGIGALVMDESTFAANKSSLNWRLCNQIRNHASICYQLAGRPFGADPSGLWAQLYLVDRGETLGETLGFFREAFFTQKKNYWGGYIYDFQEKHKERLYEILKHRSIQYSEAECGSKHKVINQVEVVRLPMEAKAYYEQFAKAVKMIHAGLRERENAFLRLRQISSGFVGFKDDETGKTASISFAKNPKLERLIELIQQVPHDRKFVVFHEFVYSGNKISEALTKLGIKHGCLKGGVKDAKAIRERFATVPKYRGLVINHRVGAYGTDGLQDVANYCFIYEAPVGPIDNDQMRRRLARKGQTHTVHEYDLVCKGTADVQILEAHKAGESLFKALVRGMVKLK